MAIFHNRHLAVDLSYIFIDRETSGHQAGSLADHSKHSSPQLFRFFPRFPSSIHQEIPLLVYLDPLDCIDARIFKVSWFLGFIFIVLCSTFQNNGCSSWVFWVIQFEMGLFRLAVSRLVYLSQNFEEKILILHFVRSPPLAPATVFEFLYFFLFKTCYV